jgi:DivIVA domain-containing protein
MTPEDIRSQRFGTRLLQGLSPEEVGAFLEDVAEAYDNVQKTNVALAARVEALEAEAQSAAASHITALRAAALQEVEALLHDAQIRAQALIDEARASAVDVLREAEEATARGQREAEEIVAGATARADALVASARGQEAAIQREIDRLSDGRLQLVDDVRRTLDSYHQWLATVDPRGRSRGRRDGPDTSNGVHDDASLSAEAAG